MLIRRQLPNFVQLSTTCTYEQLNVIFNSWYFLACYMYLENTKPLSYFIFQSMQHFAISPLFTMFSSPCNLNMKI